MIQIKAADVIEFNAHIKKIRERQLPIRSVSQLTLTMDDIFKDVAFTDLTKIKALDLLPIRDSYRMVSAAAALDLADSINSTLDFLKFKRQYKPRKWMGHDVRSVVRCHIRLPIIWVYTRGLPVDSIASVIEKFRDRMIESEAPITVNKEAHVTDDLIAWCLDLLAKGPISAGQVTRLRPGKNPKELYDVFSYLIDTQKATLAPNGDIRLTSQTTDDTSDQFDAISWCRERLKQGPIMLRDVWKLQGAKSADVHAALERLVNEGKAMLSDTEITIVEQEGA